ncbi:MAG: hypothetical protein J7578_11985 [Chitinophagaceae bacterium]|nr:hypothetical protein [Chitinophagaceae bacterium]
MRTNLLLIIISATILGSCGKKDKLPVDQPQIPFQLQQVEHKDGIILFQYNSDNQLLKVEQKTPSETAGLETTQYTNFMYENGLLHQAEYFLKVGSSFFKRTTYKYELDAQKRIAYVARTFFYNNGNMIRKDTVEYTFNMYNKLVGVEFSGENYHGYTYDSHGNYMPKDEDARHENELYSFRYESRYDYYQNPFAVNNLGIYLFSVYLDDSPFSFNQLLSAANPVYAKTIIETKELDGTGHPISSSENSYISEYTNAFDPFGGIKQAGLKYSYQRKENGNIVAGYTEQSDLKFTCIKK